METSTQQPAVAAQATSPAKPTEPESAAPATPKPDDMAAKFAALAKKERIARLAQHNLKTKEQSLTERERQIAERERMWEEEFKKSPLEAIKKRGYSYEDLTKAALNDGKFDPATEVKSVREEIERLRQENAEKEKKAQELQQTEAQKAEAQALETFKGRISETIEANKEKYELTSLYDANELVFETIEQHFLKTSEAGKPKIMSIDEACGLVEQYLESEVDRMAKESKKFQSKYGQSKTKEGDSAKPKSSVTLTNEVTSAAPSLLPAHTENDRLKRALAALG